MSANNTAFSPNPDLTAQITGSGNPVATNPAATYVSGGTTNINAQLIGNRFVSVTTAGGNSTIAYTGPVLNPGARVVVQINNDATLARTITFGTGFRATGTVVGTASKSILVEFVSDGTTLNEVARSVAAL